MDMSVIIPVYRPGEELFALLAALIRQKTVHDYEIIVVDDGSPEAQVQRLQTFLEQKGPAGARLLRLETNQGPAAARNLAVANALGRVFVFLDADCLLDADNHLECLFQAHLRHPQAIIGGGIQGFGRGYAAFCDRFCHWATNIPQPLNVTLATGHLVTAHLLVPRPAWERAGPLDEVLRTGEDTAFCLRARRLGLELRLHGDIVLRHHDRETFAALFRSFFLVGKDRRSCRQRALAPTPWFLTAPAAVRWLLVPAIAGGLTLSHLRSWWPYDKGVVLALPGIVWGMLAMAIGVAVGSDA